MPDFIPPAGQQAGAQAIVRVEIAPVEIDAQSSKYDVAHNDTGLTLDYLINHRYEKDHKRYMLGLTSPLGFKGASVAFVQMANPTLLWIADWTGSRSNQPPPIPDPVLADSSWILLDEHVEPSHMTLAADGVSPIYRISGTYIYGRTAPLLRTIDNVVVPRPPWFEDAFDRTLPVNLLKQNIITTAKRAINKNQGR